MMKTAVLFFVVFIFIHGVRAAETPAPQTPAPAAQSAGALENKRSSAVVEFSTSLNTVKTETSKEFSGVQLDDSKTFTVGVLLGEKEGFNRYLGGLGVEHMGSFQVDSGEDKSLTHLYFKFNYDRVLGPWMTDVYLSLSGQFIPAQGKPFMFRGVEYAPETGFGAEASLGWISPLGVAFNFGYRAQWRNFSYYEIFTPSYTPASRMANLGVSGVFLTASIGRF